MTFPGFSPRAHITPVPSQFFSHILPQIEDVAELKATLYFFWKLSQRRADRSARLVPLAELLADPAPASLSEPELRRGLALATARGTLLRQIREREGHQEELYYLNTPAQGQAAETPAGGPWPPEPPEERPDIFTLYEQNIGPLTPMLSQELQEAEKLYPSAWLEAAFQEAVSLNKRSWRYIQRILERWAAEGKGRGEGGRHTETAKYFQGKYGHIAQR